MAQYDDKIPLLRGEWNEAKKKFKQRAELLKKREFLEETLFNFKKGILLARLENDPLLESKECKLRELKERKLQVDHILDDWEDISDDYLMNLKERLIYGLLSVNPSHQASYETYKNIQITQSRRIECLQEILGLCNQLLRMLMEVLTLRQEIRSQSILRYLRGQNPNLLISHYLEKSHLLATQIEAKKIDDSDNQRDLEPVTANLMQRIAAECKTRWGFKKLDTQFPPLVKSLQMLIEQYHKCLVDEIQEKQQADKKIEHWIENGQWE